MILYDMTTAVTGRQFTHCCPSIQFIRQAFCYCCLKLLMHKPHNVAHRQHAAAGCSSRSSSGAHLLPRQVRHFSKHCLRGGYPAPRGHGYHRAHTSAQCSCWSPVQPGPGQPTQSGQSCPAHPPCFMPHLILTTLNLCQPKPCRLCASPVYEVYLCSLVSRTSARQMMLAVASTALHIRLHLLHIQLDFHDRCSSPYFICIDVSLTVQSYYCTLDITGVT